MTTARRRCWNCPWRRPSPRLHLPRHQRRPPAYRPPRPPIGPVTPARAGGARRWRRWRSPVPRRPGGSGPARRAGAGAGAGGTGGRVQRRAVGCGHAAAGGGRRQGRRRQWRPPSSSGPSRLLPAGPRTPRRWLPITVPQRAPDVPVAAPALSPPAVAVPVAPAVLASAPRPAPVATPPLSDDPSAICGKRVLLAQFVCMERECRSDALRDHPACRTWYRQNPNAQQP